MSITLFSFQRLTQFTVTCSISNFVSISLSMTINGNSAFRSHTTCVRCCYSLHADCDHISVYDLDKGKLLHTSSSW